MINENSKQKGQRVWLITGASRGLGRAFTEMALSRRDQVCAIARDLSPLQELSVKFPNDMLLINADVSDRTQIIDAVNKCSETFGQIDIAIVNAGQFLCGMLEEVTEIQARGHFDVNFFGALWTVQAVLPVMKKQHGGHIIQVSSIGSSGGFASVGLYGAAKAALDGMSEALAMEVEAFNITVTILQPGGYQTSLFTKGMTLTNQLPEYAGLRKRLEEMWAGSYDATADQAAKVLDQIVDLAVPPKRIILGSAAFDQVMQIQSARTAEQQKWEALSRKAG